MEAYQEFAKVYDRLMDNIDYDRWCGYLTGLLKKYGALPQGNSFDNNIVLDLGCGTGSVTKRLAKEGYDMIGVDSSPQMLQIAVENNSEDILYLLQDMRLFELYGTVEAVVSLCDSINYITEYEDLVSVFRLVNNYLDPGGVFIFDLKTEHSFAKIGEAVIAEDRDECSFIWENDFDKESRLNTYNLTLFIKAQDGRYDKYIEEHYQKAYDLEEIESALETAGLQFVAAYEAFTEKNASKENDRVYVVAKEVEKTVNV